MSTATQHEVSCPKCGGQMWDNRADKKNPKAPDYKCKNRSCDGVIWPPKNGRPAARPAAPVVQPDGPPWLDGQEEDEAAFVASAKAATHAQIVSESLATLFRNYDQCFAHALELATKWERTGVVVSLEGISAVAATLWISAKEKGLV